MQEDDFTLWEEELNEASGGANFVRSLIGIAEDIHAYPDPDEMADALEDMGQADAANTLRSSGVMGLTIAEFTLGCYALNMMPVTLFVGPDTEEGSELVALAVQAGRAARDKRNGQG